MVAKFLAFCVGFLCTILPLSVLVQYQSTGLVTTTATTSSDGAAHVVMKASAAVVDCTTTTEEEEEEDSNNNDGNSIGVVAQRRRRRRRKKNWTRNDPRRSIAPGEMPGYTGWTRPQFTLADHFHVLLLQKDPADGGFQEENDDDDDDYFESSVYTVVRRRRQQQQQQRERSDTTTTTTTGSSSSLLVKPLTFWIQCQDCGTAHPQLYARAYGPTVHAAHIVLVDDDDNTKNKNNNNQGNNVWRVEFASLMDPGQYFVEIIVAFSDVPPLSKFPMEEGQAGEPNYEGYPIPTFPRVVQVEVEYEDDDDHHDHDTNTHLRNGRTLLLLEEEASSTTTSTTNNVNDVDDDVDVDSSGTAAAADHHGFVPLHDMFLQSAETSHEEFGRWVVTGRNSHLTRQEVVAISHEYTTGMTLEGYASGRNSLGIQFQYQPFDDDEQKQPKRRRLIHTFPNDYHVLNQALLEAPHPYHVIFIGDSNTRKMNDYFGTARNRYNNYHQQQQQQQQQQEGGKTTMKTTPSGFNKFVNHRLPTNGGIQSTLSNVTQQLYQDILPPFPTAQNIVIFNIGLHEINEHCSWNNQKKRQSSSDGISPTTTTTTTRMDADFSCVEQYQTDLRMFFDAMLDVPNTRLRIFQTTTAAWPKHGNYGFTWPAGDPTYGPQPYTKSTNFVEAFNAIALDVIFSTPKYRDTIHVMDGYWCTLSRPDSREVETHQQNIGAHLVHGGVDMYEFFASEWLTILYHVAKEDAAAAAAAAT